MEGLPPDAPPTEAPPALKLRPKEIVVVILIAAVVVTAGVSVYLWTHSLPSRLTVQDGSLTAILAGNLTALPADPEIIGVFQATTTAAPYGGTGASLNLVLGIQGGFTPNTSTAPSSPGTVNLNIFVQVLAFFPRDIRPTTLALGGNDTATAASVQVTVPGTSDINVPKYTGPGLAWNGTASGFNGLVTPLVNQSSAGPDYAVRWMQVWNISETAAYNATFGFRATVSGLFEPDISVGLLLEVRNVTGTTTMPHATGATLTLSSDGGSWIVTLALVPGGLSNQSTDLRVEDANGIVLVPPTAFGNLPSSAYGSGIVYTPGASGGNPDSGYLQYGDTLTFSRSAYPTGTQIEFTSGGLVLFAATLQ